MSNYYRFYTLVPHSFGTDNPPLLDNAEAIKTKTDMLDNLLEIEIAYNLLKNGMLYIQFKYFTAVLREFYSYLNP